MKTVIVGGGASGLVAAIMIKEKHPKDEVLVIDKNNKLGKKLRATGNGKANILNLGDLSGRYQDEARAKELYTTREKLLKFFHAHHVKTVNYSDYVYPFSESANTFTDTLINEGKALGVKYQSNTKAQDYRSNVLYSDNGNFPFDNLVIATGLASQPKLGADASFVLNLTNHGYNIVPLKAGLTPLRTIEPTKMVNGIRRKAHVTLCDNEKKCFEENGELLFKKDGLSGIVIHHVASKIIHLGIKNPKVVVDFLNGEKYNGNPHDYFQEELATYFIKNKMDPKHAVFHIKEAYGYDESTVTIGGVSLDDVDQNFKSKKEDNVYIIGEALNQDGLCGGFNLMWAFFTALKVSDII